jgi:hypothetical protein
VDLPLHYKPLYNADSVHIPLEDTPEFGHNLHFSKQFVTWWGSIMYFHDKACIFSEAR